MKRRDFFRKAVLALGAVATAPHVGRLVWEGDRMASRVVIGCDPVVTPLNLLVIHIIPAFKGDPNPYISVRSTEFDRQVTEMLNRISDKK